MDFRPREVENTPPTPGNAFNSAGTVQKSFGERKASNYDASAEK